MQLSAHVASDRFRLLRHKLIEDLIADLLPAGLGELCSVIMLLLFNLHLFVQHVLVVALHLLFILLLAHLVPTYHLHAASMYT